MEISLMALVGIWFTGVGAGLIVASLYLTWREWQQRRREAGL